MIFKFDYYIEPQSVDTTLTVRLTEIESMLLNSAGKAADQLGIGIDDLKKDNYAWVVSRIAWQLDYRPQTGQTISIETWIDHVERMFSIRNFRILHNGNQIGLGRSIWTVFDLNTRRPINLMQEERFVKLSTNIDVEMDMPLKLLAVESDQISPYKSVYSDIDFNGHCNSVRYLQWMLNSLPVDEAAALPSKRVDINYLHEVMPNEQVDIVRSKTENAVCFEVRKTDGTVATRAKIEC